MAGRVFSIYRIVSAVGKHIIAGYALTCGDISIRTEEPFQFRAIVAAIEVVEAGGFVVEIAAVTEGILLQDGTIGDNAILIVNSQKRAPSVVAIETQDSSVGVCDARYIALEILEVIIGFSVFLKA